MDLKDVGLSRDSTYRETRANTSRTKRHMGDHSDDNNVDWLTHEFSFQGMRWLTLDIARVVTTGTWVANPDLTKIDEIGFADLTPGSGHGAGGWSDVATIEVYGKPVPR
jgi:hypothetical protein